MTFKKQIAYVGGGVIIGHLVQILLTRYLKTHPEILNNKKNPDTIPQPESGKPRKPGFWRNFTDLRGGELISITGVVVNLASWGPWVGGISGLVTFLITLPKDELFHFFYNASPQNLKLQSLVDVGVIYLPLDMCDQNLHYLFKTLSDEAIPFEKKEEIVGLILRKYLNLKTHSGRVNFVLCLVSILLILSATNFSSYVILIRQLLKAIKEGKISKVLARVIIRKLQKKGVPIDPEILEITEH